MATFRFSSSYDAQNLPRKSTLTFFKDAAHAALSFDGFRVFNRHPPPQADQGGEQDFNPKSCQFVLNLLFRISMETILAYLEELDIRYQLVEHQAVFTCEDAELVERPEGTNTKNLFLRNKNKTRYFLVSVRHEQRVDLKELGVRLGSERLSFANPQELEAFLGVQPGSVTLLGLINDSQKQVEVVIDRSLWGSEKLLCHPLVNTATIAISRPDLERFIGMTGHQVTIVSI